jgi:predicted GNAT superfamily acetyltransferase
MSAFIIRELRELDDLATACELFDRIWGFEDGALSILREIMRGYAYEGNYVAGAFLGSTLVGASVGHFGPPHSRALLSYVTGAVEPRAGLELKRHQRRWAMDRGIERIIWTFDPLVRRNAHFNLAKLRAHAEAYLENHYGRMPDAINGQDQSDRIRVVWHITEPDVTEAAELDRPISIKVPADTQRLLVVRPDGGPEICVTDSETILLEVPPDIEGIRRVGSDLATRWRRAVRDTLGKLVAEGGTVLGFHDKASYVVQRK